MEEITIDRLTIDASSDVRRKVLRAKSVTSLRLKDGKDNKSLSPDIFMKFKTISGSHIVLYRGTGGFSLYIPFKSLMVKEFWPIGKPLMCSKVEDSIER